MARRNHNEDLLDRLMNNFSLRGTLLHPGTLFVLATGVMIVCALQLWQQYQHRLLPAEQYQLTEARLNITPAPKWANVDLPRLLLDVPPGQTAPSILDTDVVSKSAAKLESVGWIEEVQQVKKSATGLDIDVTFRLPVAMVELNHTTIPNWDREKTPQIMPVDRSGMIMPAELLEHVQLPRISVFQPLHFEHLTTWTAWPDQRITDAASIMAFVGPRAKELGVYRVMTMRSTAQQTAAQVPFELWAKPQDRTRIIWGNAPGKESAGEATAEVKLQTLIQFVQQQGPLDKMPKRRVDLRAGKIFITKDAQVAEKEAIFDGLK